jgi:hypothetical protein
MLDMWSSAMRSCEVVATQISQQGANLGEIGG